MEQYETAIYILLDVVGDLEAELAVHRGEGTDEPDERARKLTKEIDGLHAAIRKLRGTSENRGSGCE